MSPFSSSPFYCLLKDLHRRFPLEKIANYEAFQNVYSCGNLFVNMCQVRSFFTSSPDLEAPHSDLERSSKHRARFRSADIFGTVCLPGILRPGQRFRQSTFTKGSRQTLYLMQKTPHLSRVLQVHHEACKRHLTQNSWDYRACYIPRISRITRYVRTFLALLYLVQQELTRHIIS